MLIFPIVFISVSNMVTIAIKGEKKCCNYPKSSKSNSKTTNMIMNTKQNKEKTPKHEARLGFDPFQVTSAIQTWSQWYC